MTATTNTAPPAWLNFDMLCTPEDRAAIAAGTEKMRALVPLVAKTVREVEPLMAISNQLSKADPNLDGLFRDMMVWSGLREMTELGDLICGIIGDSGVADSPTASHLEDLRARYADLLAVTA